VTPLKLHLLSDGYLKLDRSFLVYQKYMGLSYNASLKALLVVNAKKSILIDTGCGQLPEKCAKLYVVKRKPRESLKLQLANRGYEPEDIDIVVNTHLHFDHCGNNRLFPNAKFIVQAEEFRYAYEPDRFQQMAYIRESFDVDVDYELVRGKHRVYLCFLLRAIPLVISRLL
jgi:N-acyl homoserine lactone hydrolase